MNFQVFRDALEYSSSHMEVGPGKYSGKHGQPGFLFVPDVEFGVAEGVIARHFPEYCHFSTNDIPKSIGLSIASEWRAVALELVGMTESQMRSRLRHQGWAFKCSGEDLQFHQKEISAMLVQIADAVVDFCEKENWFCILGM